MKQGKNILKLEGIILEKKIAGEGVGKAGKWKKLELLIRDAKGSEIPVIMMQSEFGKDKQGNQIENTGFKGLETIMAEYKTVASDGEENADRVAITRGSLGKNVYKGRDGQLKEVIQFETRYANRVEAGSQTEDGAVVTLSGIVHKMMPKKEGTELLVRFLVPNYKGELEYFDLDVTTPEGVAYFEEEIKSGQSLEVDVDIEYKTKVTEIDVKRNFGGIKKEKSFERVRKLEISGVSEYSDENSWDIDEVKAGIKELENKYEEILKAEPKKKEQSKTFKTDKLDTKKSNNDIPF